MWRGRLLNLLLAVLLGISAAFGVALYFGQRFPTTTEVAAGGFFAAWMLFCLAVWGHLLTGGLSNVKRRLPKDVRRTRD